MSQCLVYDLLCDDFFGPTTKFKNIKDGETRKRCQNSALSFPENVRNRNGRKIRVTWPFHST